MTTWIPSIENSWEVLSGIQGKITIFCTRASLDSPGFLEIRTKNLEKFYNELNIEYFVSDKSNELKIWNESNW